MKLSYWRGAENVIILNVQGGEPLIPPELISDLTTFTNSNTN
jgi:CMP-2-keto-3-deoxyoctulosonic acid synthetase